MTPGRTSVRKALSLSFTRTLFSLAFNIATVTIVSRLLTPAEVGVFSVAVALVSLVHMLRDFGVTELIIQEKNLSDELVRTVFTVTVAIAWFLAMLVFGFSDLVGKFYGDHGVARVMRVLSLVFVLMPFGTTTLACMKRDMRFGLLIKIQITETAVRSITTIALAWLGFSYMSMAWASVAAAAVAVVGSALFGGRYRVRGLGLTDWRRVLHFGSYRTVADVAKQVGEQSANIVVGRMLGMPAAGFYSRGYGIVNIFRTSFVAAVGSVAFPAYAREHRENDAAPALFRRSMVLLTGVSWPFFAFAVLMAYPIIHLAFGHQWDPAIPLMRWLCAAAMIGTLTYQVNGLLTAVGRYREVTGIELRYQVVRIVLAVLAALHSLEAVAASQIIVYVVAVTLYYRKLVGYHALRLRVLVTALAPSAALTAITSLAPAAVLAFWAGPISAHYVPAFFVAASGSGLLWLAGIHLFRHPLAHEIRNALSKLRSRFKSSPRLG
ncbi:oligosaccharide flippase family protein [Dyella sp. A6]|uniref:oligosaccharide flippase family protein n=1 Tax=Dyella aluminiiresistens TaxID=3069105 RepID=UPI002E76A300|nr:oligosaccharide flippase family protein [Dyella sp. A6]